MTFTFRIIDASEINTIIPLVQKLNNHSVSEAVLKERFAEMVTQNYECAAIYDDTKLIGISGLWYCTRHYSGRSVELDHVYIDDAYRNNGLGNTFMEWISAYVRGKNYETIELNTYVSNHLSHKFYYNQGFKILGYHFLKKI